MWEASEDAERRSAIKRARRRRIRDDKEKAKPSERSVEKVSADHLMPPPKEVPRKFFRASSTHRRDKSMGDDAVWSPLESYSSGAAPQVSLPRADSLTPYKDAVLHTTRSMTGARTPSTGVPIRTGGPVRIDTEPTRTGGPVKVDLDQGTG